MVKIEVLKVPSRCNCSVTPRDSDSVIPCGGEVKDLGTAVVNRGIEVYSVTTGRCLNPECGVLYQSTTKIR